MLEGELLPERAEAEIEPVEVQFGDVVTPFYHGKPIDQQVVIEAAENYLQASTILKEDDGTEYLSGGGTLVWPVQVVGHWDFDQVYDGIMHFWERDGGPFPPEQREKMKKILEERFNKPSVMYTGRETN